MPTWFSKNKEIRKRAKAFYFFIKFLFLLYLDLPYIDMNPPRVDMSSRS